MARYASDVAAYRVACPECGAKKNDPCTYMWPKSVNPDADPLWHTAGVRAMIARVGQPTTQPHNGRRRAAPRPRVYRVAARPTPRVDTVQWYVALAQREFDRREYWALHAWLRQHAQIFKI